MKVSHPSRGAVRTSAVVVSIVYTPTALGIEQTQRRGRQGRCDIMHYHISVFGQYKGTWPYMEQGYRRILRKPKEVNFITVLRDPRAHLLSYYYYFLQPNTKVRQLPRSETICFCKKPTFSFISTLRESSLARLLTISAVRRSVFHCSRAWDGTRYPSGNS